MLEDLPSTEDPASTPRRRHRLRRALAVVTALVLLVAVGVGAAYVLLLNRTVDNNVKRSALLPTPGVSGAAPAPARDPAAKGAQNVLLIGSDARAGLAGARSDVIVLVHVAADRKTVHLVHFPRDLYVDVPGHGKDKINAAFAYGGAPLLVSTLQQLIGVPIDHVAVVDFDGFKNMTDAVGGVWVYVDQPSSSRGQTFTRGWSRMDGERALVFVRERKQLSEGDISRGERQQAFIKALLLKAVDIGPLAHPVKFAQLVDAGTRNLIVDKGFSTGQMRSEAIALRDLERKDVGFVTAPFTGFGTSPSGASIDIVDVAGMKRLGTALRTDRMGGYADVSVAP